MVPWWGLEGPWWRHEGGGQQHGWGLEAGQKGAHLKTLGSKPRPWCPGRSCTATRKTVGSRPPPGPTKADGFKPRQFYSSGACFSEVSGKGVGRGLL